jgi:L-seryl-tRNA(Ser) seleniumtransferase
MNIGGDQLNNFNELLRQIPKVDLIIDLLPKNITQQIDQGQVKAIIDEELQVLRHKIMKGTVDSIDEGGLIIKITRQIEAQLSPNLKRVINATGIVLHTNLGRAVFSKRTMKHLYNTMTHYNTLEYNLQLGTRGSRYDHVEKLLCKLTGAEAALIVNNNAAAVMLVLNTLANQREVILSRGELVEIGGSFRIPEVMKSSGCKLVEVGATNKTHLRDFENALTENTALLLKVHTSNYQIMGFTSEVSRKELSLLAQTAKVPFYEDLGSGAMIDFSNYGLKREPLISECLSEGVDLLSFSGDKLLGSSQSGIILGKKIHIDKLKQNQLLRAFRIDKLSLAVLEDTLIQYLNQDLAISHIPTLSMLSASSEEVLQKVTLFIKKNQMMLEKIGLRYAIEEMQSQVGGGAMPLEQLTSYGLSLRGDRQLNHIQTKLRRLQIPIICKIEDDALLFDFRTLFEDDYESLANGLEMVLRGDENE